MSKEKHGNTPVRYNKEGSKNYIAKVLYNNYKKSLHDLIPKNDINNILEIGCGKGEILNFLDRKFDFELIGIDIEREIVKEASDLYPNLIIREESGLQSSFKTSNFDLVLVLEVLEHVNEYKKIILESKRVSKKYCIFSVPREPIWRILNIIRGSYISDFGNTPGHINHWSSKAFMKLLSKYFDIVNICTPLPWTMVLCKKNG